MKEVHHHLVGLSEIHMHVNLMPKPRKKLTFGSTLRMLKHLLVPAKTFSRLLSPSFTFSMSSVSTPAKTNIVIDPFCFRQFQQNSGKVFIDYDMEKFEKKINGIYEKNGGEAMLKPGYAPFCKHIFIENFVGTNEQVLEITEETKPYLRSKYSARNEDELPVLVRYFLASDVASKIKPAKYFDIILYSGEQIEKENEAMGKKRQSSAPWGIVSIKPQSIDKELPMAPITMMRNALGKDQGGSGVSLEREKYRESVKYWMHHSSVLDSEPPSFQ